MPNFAYKAISQSGNIISGVIEAESIEGAQSLLSSKGYIPSEIDREGGIKTSPFVTSLKAKFAKVVDPWELILFTKQLRTMLIAGLPIIRSLEILENQANNPRLKEAVAAIAMDIREGASLDGAFIKHPNIFSPLYISMLNAGETSGTLPSVLERLSYILEHEHKVKSDIKAALQYPKIVAIALFVAFLILLTFVIPKFVSIYTRAGIELPLPTKVAIFLYEGLNSYWYIILGVIVLGIVAFRYIVKTEWGKYTRDMLMMKVPVMGPLFVKAAMSRFASIFSILQGSGVQVLNSMDILAGTIGNEAISRELRRIKDRIEGGHGISSPLRSAQYFTPMTVDMIEAGEETGRLDEMLHDIAVHYDDEVEYAVRRLTDAFGPILIVGLAAVVGFFALSVFLPMWDLTKMIK
ncbi:MAG: type II secretion system F family protein [Thermodesulfobacteriota bacterium]|nr:type II secretion system F family protein [Thermodesulfobacteriota bacterium]